MIRLSLKTATLAALYAICGGVGLLTVRDFREGIDASRALYAVDVQGSQLAGALESHAEECRRTYLYALAIGDPNEQLPYVDQSRAAEAELERDLKRFESMPAEPEARQYLRAFAKEWRGYRTTRDVTIARILMGDSQGALALERGAGEVRFSGALNALRRLRASLNAHAQKQSAHLTQLLQHGAAKLTLFIAMLTAMVLALLRSSNEKGALLRDLRRLNADLRAAHSQEQRRADVLKMINRNSALPDTLKALTNLAEALNAGTNTSIWVSENGEFQLKADTGGCVSGHPSDGTAGNAQEVVHDVAAQTATLRDSSGDTVGLLRVQAPEGARLPEATFAEMTQLAAMAIENRRLYERLAFQAQHDLLTQLPNRMLFQDRLEQALELARRGGSKAAVIWVDLDRYKQINDTLGHAAGDELLRIVATRLRDSVRACDTVARMGGDEFAVVLGGIQASIDAEKVAAKIQLTLALPVVLSGHEMRVSACCGISIYPDHGCDAATLVSSADLAMYSAKRSGRNASVLFQPDFGDMLKRRQQLEHDLAEAMADDELHLEYQPQVDREGNVRVLEALLRWSHPTLGEISPGELIPIAEESDAIIRLGEWVLRRACLEGLRFLESGCTIAVNVSRKQLSRPDFSSVVAHILRVTGFPAERLELEVTETTLMRHLDAVIEQVERLRALGVRFSMDDFGAGYSSLNLLGRLPVDSIKIDQSFVALLSEDQSFGVLLSGLISLAHSMQLNVVGEGVETHQQLRLLHDLECDLSQGYLLHRPMAVDKALEAVRRKAPLITQLVAG